MSEAASAQPTPNSPVTLFNIYSRQIEITATLAVMHEQLKVVPDLRATLAVMHEQLKVVPDHEDRIRRLEASRAKLVGAALAASATVSALGTWLGFVIVHHFGPSSCGPLH